jgi:hypothetical protein
MILPATSLRNLPLLQSQEERRNAKFSRGEKGFGSECLFSLRFEFRCFSACMKQSECGVIAEYHSRNWPPEGRRSCSLRTVPRRLLLGHMNTNADMQSLRYHERLPPLSTTVAIPSRRFQLLHCRSTALQASHQLPHLHEVDSLSEPVNLPDLAVATNRFLDCAFLCSCA